MQKDLADRAVAALKSVNGLTFKTGSIANVICEYNLCSLLSVKKSNDI